MISISKINSNERENTNKSSFDKIKKIEETSKNGLSAPGI
jgi:hypothetical protein